MLEHDKAHSITLLTTDFDPCTICGMPTCQKLAKINMNTASF